MAKKPKPKKVKEFNRTSWLISQLRRIFLKYPPVFQKVNSLKQTYYITSKKGLQLKRVKWNCQICDKEITNKEMRRDHVHPVVDPVEGFKDIGTFIDRLFCDPDNIQVICKTCHDSKSEEERKIRKENKR